MHERKPGASNQKFYNSADWRRTAAQHKASNPLCAICEENGQVTPADVTDHIIPINEGGARFDWQNLQSLCHPHHNQKSGREAHKKE